MWQITNSKKQSHKSFYGKNGNSYQLLKRFLNKRDSSDLRRVGSVRTTTGWVKNRTKLEHFEPDVDQKKFEVACKKNVIKEK